MAQPHGIHADTGQRDGRRIAQELDALGRGARRQQLHRLFDQLEEIATDRIELEAARLDLREVENVVDDRQQRIRGTVNGFGKASLRRIDACVEQQAGHAEDAVHRRTQFVAHAGHEVALGAAQYL